MTDYHEPPRKDRLSEFDDLDRSRLSHLFLLGFDDTVTPVESLLRRLRQPDGDAWLTGALAAGPFQDSAGDTARPRRRRSASSRRPSSC